MADQTTLENAPESLRMVGMAFIPGAKYRQTKEFYGIVTTDQSIDLDPDLPRPTTVYANDEGKHFISFLTKDGEVMKPFDPGPPADLGALDPSAGGFLDFDHLSRAAKGHVGSLASHLDDTVRSAQGDGFEFQLQKREDGSAVAGDDFLPKPNFLEAATEKLGGKLGETLADLIGNKTIANYMVSQAIGPVDQGKESLLKGTEGFLLDGMIEWLSKERPLATKPEDLENKELLEKFNLKLDALGESLTKKWNDAFDKVKKTWSNLKDPKWLKGKLGELAFGGLDIGLDQAFATVQNDLFGKSWAVDDSSSAWEQIRYKYAGEIFGKLQTMVTDMVKEKAAEFVDGLFGSSITSSLGEGSAGPIAQAKKFIFGEPPTATLPAARVKDAHTCPMVDPGPKPHVGGPVGGRGIDCSHWRLTRGPGQ